MTNRVHFFGIKGVGMTALALAMADAGYTVSGSDTLESFITDDILSKRQIRITALDAPLPDGLDQLIYSAAYTPPQTPKNVRSLSLAEALAEFVGGKRVIAVSGVGGKTTTTAMLAALFHHVGRDVGYYVGTGSIATLKAPGAAGSDPYFVVEADEYAISKTDPRPKFALLNPEILITTNIIHDHPDIYADVEATLQAFGSLVSRISTEGYWIYNDSDPLSLEILNKFPILCHKIPYNSNLPQLDLSVFGAQNQLDAQAAVLAAKAAGVNEVEAKAGIKAYQGAGRRQEFRGVHQGRLLYDDYGHHPKEIKLTVASFKEKFPESRLILVFESHTYSRTESLLNEFAESLASADLVYIMPIFESAREKGKAHQITTESFAKLVPNATPLTWENASKTIWDQSRAGDIILTMGAGFVYKLHDEFKKYA